MADKKISALPSSTTPLAGTEALPIVQSSTTRQVSVANLTAGRAVSAASLALTSSPLPATSGGTGQSAAFTANGVVYASSTSALATGTGLQFDGTKLGIGTSAPDRKLDVESNNAEAIRLSSGSYLSAGQGPWIGFDGGPSADWNMARIQATRAGTEFQGNLVFYTNNSVSDATAATEKFRITNDGNLVVGTAGKGITTSGSTTLGLGTNGNTAQATLDTSGNLTATGTLSATSIIPTGAPSSKWAIDGTNAALLITLDNDATYDLAPGAGVIYAWDNGGNGVAVAYTFYGTVAIAYNPSAFYTTTQNNAGTVNVYYNGVNNYRFQNKTGSAKSIYIMTIRNRAAT